MVNNKPFKVHCFNDNFSDIYYTTDGSIPTTASAPLTDPGIPVSGGTKLTVRAICNQPEYSKTETGEFQASQTFLSVTPPKSVQSGGLHYTYYWLKDTADLAHAKPVFSGRADSSFKLGKKDDPEKYVLILNGFIKVPQEGYYILFAESWGGTKLYLGKQLVIDQPDTDHVDLQGAVVPLQSGYYPIRIEHTLKISQQKINLLYVLPHGVARDEGPKPILWQAYYSQKEE